jgi:predicted phosphodiesterase
MKIVAIGDIHGKPVWKQVFEENKDADIYLFMGDYVDSRDAGISDEDIFKNLLAIIKIKKLLGEHVVLLLGNHDLQYIYYPAYPCSGFRPASQPLLTRLFQENDHLFQVAYQYKNYLYTHAGVSNKWFAAHKKTLKKLGLASDLHNIGDVLNQVNQSKKRDILHEVSDLRGGWHAAGGITWADKQETMPHPLPGFHQVVGHSRVKDIIKVEYGDQLPDTSITYIDCLDAKTAFYRVEIA